MKVVVVGAGYAGTIAANRLARKVKDADITVVNPRPDFVERVRLHEQLAGTGSAATELTEMLRDGISTKVGVVDKIGDGSVALEDGASLDFDYLFVAVGSTVTPLPGAIPVGTLEGAEQARNALADLPRGSVVTVVGGGLTGIETAAEIAEAWPAVHVRLVGESIGASLSAGAQNRVRADLAKLNVEIVEDSVAEVFEPSRRHAEGRASVALRSGEEVVSDLTLWAIIDSVPDLVVRSGFEVNADGRAVVDEYLRSVTDQRVFIVGDCAAVPGARFACATATPQGAHAAGTLVRIIKGRKLKRFSMGYSGQAVSLGRKRGILQMSRRDDRTLPFFIPGRIGGVSKEGINRYAKYGSRTANYGWLPGRVGSAK